MSDEQYDLLERLELNEPPQFDDVQEAIVEIKELRAMKQRALDSAERCRYLRGRATARFILGLETGGKP